VQERFNRESVTSKEKTAQIAEEANRYGEGYLIHPRLGQGAFRVMVTELIKDAAQPLEKKFCRF
jgi:hypothetical protein